MTTTTRYPVLGMLTMALLAWGSISNAQQGPNKRKGPPISGIFAAAASFLNDPPGQGLVTKLSCVDGTDLGGGNIRMNCDSTSLPHNETSIAADPSDANHLVAGSNDYEISFVGARAIERIIAGYYTSFDGGATWLNGRVPVGGFVFSGDPSVAFNAKFGVVHYGVIAFNGGQGGGFADASVQVNTSTDGGVTFGRPVVVARGVGGTNVTV